MCIRDRYDYELIEHLTELTISNTPLTRVPLSVCQLANLESLDLYNNRLGRLPDNCFTNMTKSRDLSARRNNITELQDGLFDGLISLKYLNFEWNRIAVIGLRVFSNPNDLTELTSIKLDHNSLESLEPWPYIRGLHGKSVASLLKVDISVKSNYIYKFTNNIGWRVNCSQASYANLDISDNYVMHLADLASGWNISSRFEWLCMTYPEYDLSRKRYEYSFEIILASSHSYYCDCSDIFFLMTTKRLQFSSLLNGVRCSWPLSLANQTAIDVSLYEFVCDWSEQSNCPPGCQCVYRPANFTIHI